MYSSKDRLKVLSINQIIYIAKQIIIKSKPQIYRSKFLSIKQMMDIAKQLGVKYIYTSQIFN